MRLLLEEFDISDNINNLKAADISRVRDIVLEYVSTKNAYLVLLQILSKMKLPVVFRNESERDKFLDDIVQTNDEKIIRDIEQYQECDTLNKALFMINLDILSAKYVEACKRFLIKIFDSFGNNLAVYKELLHQLSEQFDEELMSQIFPQQEAEGEGEDNEADSTEPQST